MVSWGEFIVSPGFGGVAAVTAAVIAWWGVMRTVAVQRETARKDQWWGRARWSLDLTLSDDAVTREVGLAVLDALTHSEYAKEHEAEMIDAAVAPTIALYWYHRSEGQSEAHDD